MVLSGTLAEPYRPATVRFVRGPQTSDDVQIDHVVALSDAWQKGAQQWTPQVRRAFANDPANLLAVVMVDGHYSITGGQPLGVPDVFGGVAAALGLATATARTASEICEHVASLPRPGVLEVRYEDRAWPGPSPFVDAPVVRYRFEEAAGGL